ncbi:MAG: hypothetical protein A2Z14_10745 [Chloroflexi bacterium RBG_16_48_8]|nr:MAG: hypothetical protein A2Z14_10745 [Chloroflexi bacterium RBG_16_48_8]
MVVVPDQGLVVVFTAGHQQDPFDVKLIMQSFFFEAASPYVLPDHPEGVTRLNDKVLAVGEAPEPEPVPALPEIALTISGKTFEMLEMENQLGWKEVKLTFPGGSEASFFLVAEGLEIEFPVGLDGLFRIPSEESGFPEEFLVAMRGWWETENIFQLEYDVVYGMERNILLFVFEGDLLEVQVITPQGSITLAKGVIRE